MSSRDDSGFLWVVGAAAFIAIASFAKWLGVDLETAGKLLLNGILIFVVIGFLVYQIPSLWPVFLPATFLVAIPALDYHARNDVPVFSAKDVLWYGTAGWQLLIFASLSALAAYIIWRNRY